MPLKLLTTKFVESVKPTKKLEVYSDTVSPNLLLNARATLNHTWSWRGRVDSKQVTITLGSTKVHTLSQAREWADKLTINRDAKQDVVEIVQVESARDVFVAGLTGDACFELYMEHAASELRSKGQILQMWKKDLKPVLGHLKVKAIDHDLLMGILRKKLKTAPAVSNNLESLLSAWFNWCVKGGSDLTKMTTNPAANLTKLHKPVSRSRYLNEYEIGLLLRSIADLKSRLALPTYFLLYLGLRRAEVFEAEWPEFNLDAGEWLIPKERMKNNTPHMVPLVPHLVSLLRAQLAKQISDEDKTKLVFPSPVGGGNRPLSGYSDWMELLIEKMRWFATKDGKVVDHWILHDLRRTFSSGLNGMRDAGRRRLVSKETIERCLAHKETGVAAVYDRYDYIEDKVGALTVWANHIEKLRDLFGVPQLAAPLLALPAPSTSA